MPRQLKEGARLLAQAAQQETDDVPVGTRQEALACLRAHAHEREFVHACCIGCGQSKGLMRCGKCRVAQWCGAECAKRRWPVHKACCKVWVGAPDAARAAATS